MNRVHGGHHFESLFVESVAEGWAAVDLFQIGRDTKQRVARVAYWDAMGQFSVETFVGDVPLTIVEELIEEAKRAIPTK